MRRYATADVEEVAALARMLGGAAFALAQMAPRRYERLADAGAATGVIDPLLVRAYLRAGMALPAHQHGDGTPHSGAALHLFATGVAQRVVKADVASLYPSLMRAYRIGPARDRLGALLALVDRLVERRLAAKAQRARRAAGLGRALHARGDVGGDEARRQLGVRLPRRGRRLTRFADVHAANEVTRRGRETLELMCRELAARGVTLLEADTDGVYFAVPEAGPRPTSGAWSPRSPRSCRRWCSSSSTAATRRCCRTSRRTTRCSATTARCCCAASRSARAAPSRSARRSCGAPSRACSRRRRRRARCVPRHAGCAAPPRAADVRRVVARAPDQDRRSSISAARETRRELPYEALLASGRTIVERRRSRARLSHQNGPAASSKSRKTKLAERECRCPRLRRRSLCARAPARHVRRPARARLHAGRLRGAVRRPRPDCRSSPRPIATIRRVSHNAP